MHEGLKDYVRKRIVTIQRAVHNRCADAEQVALGLVMQYVTVSSITLGDGLCCGGAGGGTVHLP